MCVIKKHHTTQTEYDQHMLKAPKTIFHHNHFCIIILFGSFLLFLLNSFLFQELSLVDEKKLSEKFRWLVLKNNLLKANLRQNVLGYIRKIHLCCCCAWNIINICLDFLYYIMFMCFVFTSLSVYVFSCVYVSLINLECLVINALNLMFIPSLSHWNW